MSAFFAGAGISPIHAGYPSSFAAENFTRLSAFPKLSPLTVFGPAPMYRAQG